VRGKTRCGKPFRGTIDTIAWQMRCRLRERVATDSGIAAIGLSGQIGTIVKVEAPPNVAMMIKRAPRLRLAAPDTRTLSGAGAATQEGRPDSGL
jgi:hypothetical protein